MAKSELCHYSLVEIPARSLFFLKQKSDVSQGVACGCKKLQGTKASLASQHRLGLQLTLLKSPCREPPRVLYHPLLFGCPLQKSHSLHNAIPRTSPKELFLPPLTFTRHVFLTQAQWTFWKMHNRRGKGGRNHSPSVAHMRCPSEPGIFSTDLSLFLLFLYKGILPNSILLVKILIQLNQG